ncbi:hypothetical protein D3C71_1630710 [compost metagenome]
MGQARHGVVGGVYKGQYFDGGGSWHFQRLQIIVAAAVELFAQLQDGQGGPAHYENDDTRNAGKQQRLLEQGAQQDLSGQGFADLQCFCHLHDGHAAPVGAGYRLQ